MATATTATVTTTSTTATSIRVRIQGFDLFTTSASLCKNIEDNFLQFC